MDAVPAATQGGIVAITVAKSAGTLLPVAVIKVQAGPGYCGS